jgi:uncharacterized protein
VNPGFNQGAVLIAAFSGRALAASARKAGYTPLVVDGYGDLDTLESAEHHVLLRDMVTTGVTAKPLLAALATLAQKSTAPIVGLVLGAGFEDHPKLMETLASHYTLLGTAPEAVARVKNPAEVMYALTTLGVVYPKTQLTPPRAASGWLIKKAGGSGGRHVRDWSLGAKFSAADYFQTFCEGSSISVLGVVSAEGDAFAFSRQWTAPNPKSPYCFGGATGPLTLDEDLEARLIDTAMAISRHFNLVGLVSFDFIVNETEASLIDINPRPGATLDIFEDGNGTLFKAHVAAATGANPAAILQSEWQPPVARAMAYLYANRGPLTLPSITWPDWAHDRGAPGTRIMTAAPIATVTAEANTPDEAERLCGERLGLLQSMLYDKTV